MRMSNVTGVRVGAPPLRVDYDSDSSLGSVGSWVRSSDFDIDIH